MSGYKITSEANIDKENYYLAAGYDMLDDMMRVDFFVFDAWTDCLPSVIMFTTQWPGHWIVKAVKVYALDGVYGGQYPILAFYAVNVNHGASSQD